MKNKIVNSLWITGITDAEGNFSINYNSKSEKFSFSYKVTQKGNSVAILDMIKSFFNEGNIYLDNKKFDGYKFTISNRTLLKEVIIPHFSKFTLLTSKNLDFIDFSKAIDAYELGNIDKVLFLKNRMNSKRSFDERWEYMSNKIFNIKPEWLQAFIDGEGSFQFNVVNTSNRGKPYIHTNACLEISQNTHDVKLLEAMKSFFNNGYIKPKFNINCLSDSKKVRSVSRFVINNEESVLKFIDKFPMYSVKHLDYLDWKQLIGVKKEKKEDMLKQINYIRSNMNSKRLFNSNLLSSDTKLLLLNDNKNLPKSPYHTNSKVKKHLTECTNNKNNNKTMIKKFFKLIYDFIKFLFIIISIWFFFVVYLFFKYGDGDMIDEHFDDVNQDNKSLENNKSLTTNQLTGLGITTAVINEELDDQPETDNQSNEDNESENSDYYQDMYTTQDGLPINQTTAGEQEESSTEESSTEEQTVSGSQEPWYRVLIRGKKKSLTDDAEHLHLDELFNETDSKNNRSFGEIILDKIRDLRTLSGKMLNGEESTNSDKTNMINQESDNRSSDTESLNSYVTSVENKNTSQDNETRNSKNTELLEKEEYNLNHLYNNNDKDS